MQNDNINHREFNDTGLCVPHLHYMAHRAAKLKELVKLAVKGKYFTINRPRQYGKTTFMYLLEKDLEKNGTLVIKISFEGVGDTIFTDEKQFAPGFLKMLQRRLSQKNKKLSDYLLNCCDKTQSMQTLSDVITELCNMNKGKVVLAIDEVDKSSNNQLFLSFLGMLRAKYLLRNEGADSTFHSVILAGVHDVKNLKLNIRPGDEPKYNSPWNIAVDLNVDFNLDTGEIENLLRDYLSENPIAVDTAAFSRKLFYLTTGHPFLVSRLCKIIVEDIRPVKEWTSKDLDNAVNILLKEDNTNFKSLVKNLENNRELYELVYKIVMDGDEVIYNRYNPLIEMGVTHGVFEGSDGRVKVHNRLYEQQIFNYMTSKINTSVSMGNYNFREHFLEKGGGLNLKEVLLRFQAFMTEQYSEKDRDFIERNGRLLFLAFLKPVINGKGYDFKEVEISEEKRLDVVVTYLDKKHIIELKKWYGEKAHQRGLKQLAGYLGRQSRDSGYLVVFDTRRKRGKSGDSEQVTLDSKKIFVVYV
ncbi:MAG: AAA family ATPase [bacterium]|nr:AAA family ATPase [bacterium]